MNVSEFLTENLKKLEIDRLIYASTDNDLNINDFGDIFDIDTSIAVFKAIAERSHLSL